MNPGDLRRFKDNSTTRANKIAGMTFLVVDIDACEIHSCVSILMDGLFMKHWVHDFVLGYSETLNETF